MLPQLVHGREQALLGDEAYGADRQREAMGQAESELGFHASRACDELSARALERNLIEAL